MQPLNHQVPAKSNTNRSELWVLVNKDTLLQLVECIYFSSHLPENK